MKLFPNNMSLTDIVREQYYLAKEVNLDWNNTLDMYEFEREACINLLNKDKKEEQKQIEELRKNR